MRHRIKTKKLNRNSAHREAMLRNLVKALILKQSIMTTTARAKEAKRFAERIITTAMKEDGNAHRRVFQVLADKKCVKKLFSEIIPNLGGKPSGHLRILRMGQRKGDGADMALIEFILGEKETEKKAKGKKKGEKKGKARRRMPRLGRRKTKEKAKTKEDETEKEQEKKKKPTKRTKSKREVKATRETKAKKEKKIRKKT